MRYGHFFEVCPIENDIRKDKYFLRHSVLQENTLKNIGVSVRNSHLRK